MSNDNKKPTEIEPNPIESKDKSGKPYHKPRLEDLGDLRTITLGGSPGINDSGAGDPYFPPEI